MSGRPAQLDSSLLARKGDARPVIPDDSPLTESVEGATSDVIPLHRVESAGPEPAQAALVPSMIHTAPAVSPRRRAVVILIALLVLALVAIALAFRGNRGHQPGTGAAGDPVPGHAVTATAQDPAPPSAAEVAKAPPETPAPPAAAAPEMPPAPPASPAAGEAPATSPEPPAAALPPAAPLRKPVAETPAAAPAPPTAPYLLQFASVRGERRARQEAARLQKLLARVLDGRKIVVVGTEVRGRTRYRLRAGGFDSLRTAISACRRVAHLKVDCLPIRR